MVSKQLGVNCVLRPGLRQPITIFCRRSSVPITLYVLPFGSTVLRNPFFHVCRSLNTQVFAENENIGDEIERVKEILFADENPTSFVRFYYAPGAF